MSVTALDEYRPRLGGSTIAAAAGIDPYCSPIRLWLQLTRGEQPEENEAMRLGKKLEPVIFAELNERGVTCERTPGIELYDPDRPWLVGHPDGIGVGDYAGTIVEAKARNRADTLAIWHEAQVQTYLHLAGEDQGLVAQLSGLHLDVFPVERRQPVIDVLLDLAARFMDDVRSGTQPAPNCHPDDRAALALAWPDAAPGKVVRETREVRDARKELALLLEREKASKARGEHLRAVITDHMQDADTLISLHDDVVATWRNVTTHRVDTRALKAEVPHVAEAYTSAATYRRLEFK